jgi:hypothetical protein
MYLIQLRGCDNGESNNSGKFMDPNDPGVLLVSIFVTT